VSSFPSLSLPSQAEQSTLPSATSPKIAGQKRGPVARRRYQKGKFEIVNRRAYTLFYEDVQQPDGSLASRRVRQFIGTSGPEGMSERSARREHDLFMQGINLKRGSVAPATKGQTFNDVVTAWRNAVAPHLSPSTVRQRESYLRTHIIPRFGDSAPHSLNTPALQQFATDLRKTLSRKSVANILSAIFAILDYATKCGVRVTAVSFADLQLGEAATQMDRPFFTREQAALIIDAAPEPYKTMFAVAWSTGLRAGELLALTTTDLDFNRKTVRVSKSSDDNTREIRQPKTKKSCAMLPMPSALEAMLRGYLEHHWKPNPSTFLFPNAKGTHPRWRDNVVKYGLKPVLKKLGIPTKDTGLHAFRHGLATELAEQAVPLTVLQTQMRHADIKTTLRIYAHAIPQTQRDVMERLKGLSIGTSVPIEPISIN
jgi:integrase